MSEQPSGKICVICGEDCAGQPRTKDAKGNYYHQDCYDAARRACAAHEAAAAVPAEEQLAAPEEEPDPFGLLNEVIDQSAPSGGDAGFAGAGVAGAAAAASAGVGAGQMCPGCATPLSPGAVICLNCGMNVQTGQAVGTTAMAAPGKAKGGRGEGAIWPMVIGILSIIFGSCSALLYGLSLVTSIADLSGQPAAYIFGAVTAPVVVILLAVWLLLSGVGILRRRPSAAVQIRRWAIVKTILCGVCFGCVSVALVASASALEQFQSQMGAETGSDFSDIGLGLIFAVFAVFFAWVLFWPIFILVWFGRAKIQNQVESW